MLYSKVVKKVKVRNGVFAYKYQSGVIEIDGTKYFLHSLTSAIREFRRKNK
jgi:hypothetical protein